MALSVVGSPRALVFSVFVGALVLGFGWVLPRMGARPAVTVITQAVPVAVAFAVTVLPAFLGSTADEPPPGNPAAVAPGLPGDLSTTVGQGDLQGLDHEATGHVGLLALPDGTGVVRFEGLDVEPGPDYHVHVVAGAGRSDPSGGIELDRLRASRGNQNYPVPAGTALTRPLTVLVWCRAFAVPVAAATLR